MEIWAWGLNTYGMVGKGDTGLCIYPRQITAITTNGTSPLAIPNNIVWKSVAGGKYHSVALDTNGHYWAWGYSRDGALGMYIGVSHMYYPRKLDQENRVNNTSTYNLEGSCVRR